jgi:hypothetical protein
MTTAESYRSGFRSGQLKVKNSPWPPYSGIHAMNYDSYRAPDDRIPREIARKWADPNYVSQTIYDAEFAREQRAHFLGQARGIRATAWHI